MLKTHVKLHMCARPYTFVRVAGHFWGGEGSGRRNRNCFLGSEEGVPATATTAAAAAIAAAAGKINAKIDTENQPLAVRVCTKQY